MTRRLSPVDPFRHHDLRRYAVRAALRPLLLSLVASWSCGAPARSCCAARRRVLRACVLFNATIMVAVETFAATPDAPGLAFAALFLLGLARVEETGKGAWWLLVGIAGGLGL
jgi:4-amino-4-deoxy-L-arabinose transferase-like glycosyltransferase